MVDEKKATQKIIALVGAFGEDEGWVWDDENLKCGVKLEGIETASDFVCVVADIIHYFVECQKIEKDPNGKFWDEGELCDDIKKQCAMDYSIAEAKGLI